MSNVHPAFQQIIAAHMLRTHTQLFVEYVAMLKAHSWTYNESDDQHAWRSGSLEHEQIKRLQTCIDPEYKIWNQHCPVQFQRGINRVVPALVNGL